MILYLKKIVHKFKYAFQGLFHGLLHDHSILLQTCIGCLVVLVFCFLGISVVEWCILIAFIAAIIALEFLNSAIETIVDFISPEYHEKAKIMKDYAAASVLVLSIGAAIAGLLILKGAIGW